MSDILKTVHESAKGLHNANLMDDKEMSKFDKICSSDDQEQNFKELIPNEETIKAMEEARAGIGLATFNSVEELMEDLQSEDD